MSVDQEPEERKRQPTGHGNLPAGPPSGGWNPVRKGDSMSASRMQVQEPKAYCRGWIGRAKYTRQTRRVERHEAKHALKREAFDALGPVEKRKFSGWVW